MQTFGKILTSLNYTLHTEGSSGTTLNVENFAFHLNVDISGKAVPSGKPRCIAFRADMDALSMVEANTHLEYCSKNHGKAHMCGHDGHMTCLVGFVPLFLQKI